MSPRKAAMLSFLALVAVLGVVVLFSGLYTLDEATQAVILQFGQPVGKPVVSPGLHWKMPLIQSVRLFEKRLLAWDGDPNQIPTRGREFISVDTTARWRIVDPLKFLQSVENEMGAQSRLDDIIDSVVRDKISGSALVEIVRSDDWAVSEADLQRLEVTAREDDQSLTRPVLVGRKQLTREILLEAATRTGQLGIELVDVRIKRLNYIEDVRQQVYNRMTSERQRIAEQFRSEGQGEASRIEGDTTRQLAQIQSEASREAEVIRGEADAEAMRIYNEAYGKNPEFYAFLRTLDSYARSLGEEAVLVIGADSDYFRYLRRIDGGQDDAKD